MYAGWVFLSTKALICHGSGLFPRVPATRKAIAMLRNLHGILRAGGSVVSDFISASSIQDAAKRAEYSRRI